MSIHDDRCATRKGFPCNCPSAAFAETYPLGSPALPCGCTPGATPEYVRELCGCLREPRSTYHIFRECDGKRRFVERIAGVTEAEKNEVIVAWMRLRWDNDARYVSERIC